MKRSDFFKTAGLAAGSLMMPQFLFGKNQKRPNIILLLSDDRYFDTIHALGNEHINTPNLDSLVRNGTSFMNAYIMGGGYPRMCLSTRAMLLSGRTLFRIDGIGTNIPKNHLTLPEVLRMAGYTTFHAGIWRQDDETFARGFMAGNTNSNDLFNGNEAVQFLQQYRDEKPFFMYVSYFEYFPRIGPLVQRETPNMYDPDKIPLPKNFMPEHPFDNGAPRDNEEKYVPWPRTPEAIRKHIADYYAILSHEDAQIGRILDALKKTGQAENTIIVFTADQGLAAGRHGLMGKQSLYEHSIRMPLIFSGPGIPKGEKRDALCYLTDINPTLCELAGASIPESYEGCSSLVPILGRKKKIRETLLFAYCDSQRGVRNQRYKLIEYVVKGKRTTQLFDLHTDPWEMNNLVDDPKYSGHLKLLRKELLRWKDELDDTQDQGKTFWRGYSAGK